MIARIVFGLILVVGFAGPLRAERAFSGSLSVGPILHGRPEFKGINTFGLDVEGSVAWHATSRLSMRVDGVWIRFSARESGIAPYSLGDVVESVFRGKLELAGAKVNVLAFAKPRTRVGPYLIGGLGLFTVKDRHGTNPALLIAPGFGARFGRGPIKAGFEVNLGTLMVEGGDTTAYVPIRGVIWF